MNTYIDRLAARHPELSRDEILRRVYASYSDAELHCQIIGEQERLNQGYHPDELDLTKRGFNPDTCRECIQDLSDELRRRTALPAKPSVAKRFWKRLFAV